MEDGAAELNHSLEEDEKRKNDKTKQRREGSCPFAQSHPSLSQPDAFTLCCTEPGCDLSSCQKEARCCGSGTACIPALTVKTSFGTVATQSHKVDASGCDGEGCNCAKGPLPSFLYFVLSFFLFSSSSSE